MKYWTWFDELAQHIREENMMRWKCSFCGKHEDSGMVHTTCIIPDHLFFCRSCNAQWEGQSEMTNINLIIFKSEMEKKNAETSSKAIPD
jgi:hypothetical protein